MYLLENGDRMTSDPGPRNIPALGGLDEHMHPPDHVIRNRIFEANLQIEPDFPISQSKMAKKS